MLIMRSKTSKDSTQIRTGTPQHLFSEEETPHLKSPSANKNGAGRCDC